MLLEALACQVLLSFTVEAEGPVRFGVPLPSRHLRHGLQLDGPTRALQWSVLTHEVDAESARIWVEVAVDASPGTYRISRGRVGPSPDGSGDVVERTVETTKDVDAEITRTTWNWRSGATDRVCRTLDSDPGSASCGEWRTERSQEHLGRRTRVRIAPTFWRRCGVLPPDDGTGRDLRARLFEVLPELPRAEGHPGDYVRGTADDRGRRIKTNLEYDTVLGFVRLGLVADATEPLRRALESATYLCDRNIDLRSGLPFRHARTHRSGRPELGHCWWSGALLTALTYADRGLRDQALSIGRSVARAVQSMPPAETIRDLAWPLLELEQHLALQHEPVVADACGAIAAELLDRWDAGFGVVRFAEGEIGRGRYRERCWQVGGILVPGLRRFAERTGSAEARRVVERIEQRLMKLVRAGKPGLPIQFDVSADDVYRVARRSDAPIGCLLLDGLSTSARRRLLARRQVRRAIDDVLDPNSETLATDFSLVARCRWVMQ